MPGVHFCSDTNSTFFTDCCGSAICDGESQCPRCHKEVLPLSHRGRWEMAMQAFYGTERLTKMRAKYSKIGG